MSKNIVNIGQIQFIFLFIKLFLNISKMIKSISKYLNSFQSEHGDVLLEDFSSFHAFISRKKKNDLPTE